MLNLSLAFRRMAVLFFLFALGLSAQSQTTRVRLMAANISSGNQQSYIDHGNRIFQGLDPDIVMIQEFNIGASASQDATVTNTWVNDNFGGGYSWYREGGNEQIPNGIISRYPILQTGEWIDSNVSNRDFAWARIDIPGDVDLWAISVHLLTTSSSNRNNQATLLRTNILNTIPSGDYVVIGGDFNTDSRSEACISTLSSVVTTGSPYPVDKNNNGNTNAGRNKPYDWVLVNSGLNALKTAVVIGSNTFSNGLVFDSRVYTPLTEVSPVQSSDSGATNMQHMGVIKDFLIPNSGSGPTDDFSVSPTSINFGTVDAADAPFNNSNSTITVANSFQLNSVAFTGANASEFSLVTPNLSGGAVTISVNTPLAFRWTPVANDGLAHTATAQFNTGGTPSSFSITLSGTTQTPPGEGGGEPIDASGYIVQQINSTQQVTLPAGTIVPANKCLIVGRDATKAQFESVYGTLPAGTVYFNSGSQSITMPAINGSEQFRLLNAGSSPVDPLSGYHPSAGGISTGLSYSRNATNTGTFTSVAMAAASPGVYNGTKAGTNKLVITEFSDAAAFANEFVEIYNDAAVATPPAAPTGLMATPGNAVVGLDWNDSSAGGLQGYNVYRATISGGPYTKLNGSLVASSAYTDSTVANGTTYYYVVTATANALESSNSAQVFALPQVPIPEAPLNLEANAGDATVALDWDDSGATGLQGYNIYRATVSDGPYTKLNGALLSSSNYTDATAQNGTTYYYVVTVQASGLESEYSDEVAAQPEAIPTAPPAPAGLVATAGISQVMLDWNDSVAPAQQGYSVYRSTVNGGPYTKLNGAPLAGSNYTDATVSNSTTYYYVVTITASNLESAYSNQAVVTTITPASPVAPTGLTAVGGVAQIALNWDDSPTTGVQGFHLYRSTISGGPYVRLTSALRPQSDFVDSTVNGVRYYYVATETSGDVESTNSLEVSAVSLPAPPTGVQPVAGNAKVTVHWNAVSDAGLQGYLVYRAPQSYGPFTKVTESPVAGTEYIDTEVVNGTVYYYSIKAVVADVESYYSDVQSATPSARAAASDSWALFQ